MVAPLTFSGASVFNVQAVTEGILTADPTALLPWVTDVYHDLREVEGLPDRAFWQDTPLDHGTQGLINGIKTKSPKLQTKARKTLAGIVRGLGERGQWETLVQKAVARDAPWIRGSLPSSMRFLATPPKNLGTRQDTSIWEWLRESNDWAHLGDEEITKIFRACRKTSWPDWVSIEQWKRIEEAKKKFISKIAAHKDGPNLCQRAVENGYAFREAIDHCLDTPDPLATAAWIEAKMKRFWEVGLEAQYFSELSELDKLALYAAAVPFLTNRFMADTSAVPPYEIFLKDIEMVWALMGPQTVSEIFSILSPLTHMLTYVHKIFSRLPDPFEPIRPMAEYTGMDILRFLYRNRELVELSEEQLQGIYRILARGHNDTLERFHSVTWYLRDFLYEGKNQGVQDMAAAIKQDGYLQRLLERMKVVTECMDLFLPKGSKIIPKAFYDFLWHQFLFTPREEMKRYFSRYQKRPLLETEWAALPEGEKAVVYFAVGRLAERTDMFFPTYHEFNFFMRMQSRIHAILGGSISLKEIAEDYAQVKKVFPTEDTYEFFDSIVKGIHPYLGKNAFFLRMCQQLLRGKRTLNGKFAANASGKRIKMDRCFAALELYEAGYDFTGDLLDRYAAAPDRLQKMEAAKERARELAAGAPIGSMLDPFEVMAVHNLFPKTRLPTDDVISILRDVNVPRRAEGVYYRPFSFHVDLVKPFYDVADKGVLEMYVEEIRRISTLAGLVKAIQSFSGNKEALRKIAPFLRELEEVLGEESLEKEVDNKNSRAVLKVLGKILDALGDWARDRVALLQKEGEKKVTVEQKALREIEPYFTTMLIAWTYPHAEIDKNHYARIFSFNKKKSSGEETYGVLDSLSEFYIFHANLRKALFMKGFNSAPSHLTSIMVGLNRMNFRKKERLGNKVEMTLLPAVGKLDAFYGYLSENCLAKPEWAVHGMSDPDFVPYRILVKGEWRGVVQTFTKNVTIGGVRKKILIVTGVDPQLNLTPSPKEFLDGLERGFWEIAEEGGYDMVVVPALDFAQSSRRALLRTAFKRYREEIEIDAPVGFPKIGENPDGSPKYYNDVAHRKFLVFRSPKP